MCSIFCAGRPCRRSAGGDRHPEEAGVRHGPGSLGGQQDHGGRDGGELDGVLAEWKGAAGGRRGERHVQAVQEGKRNVPQALCVLCCCLCDCGIYSIGSIMRVRVSLVSVHAAVPPKPCDLPITRRTAMPSPQWKKVRRKIYKHKMIQPS